MKKFPLLFLLFASLAQAASPAPTDFGPQFQSQLQTPAGVQYDARDRNWALSSGTDTISCSISNVSQVTASALVNTSPPSYTNGTMQPVSMTLAGGLRVDASAYNVPVLGNVASGATDSGAPVKVGAIVNTTVPTFTAGQRSDLQANVRGSVYVDFEGRKTTYSATAQFSPAASATDVFTVYGSASKTIRIRRFTISGTNTGNTNANILVAKRSAVNTGGTSGAVTAVPVDSTNAAATATVLSYTGNPTTGTLVGNVITRLFFLASLSSLNVSTPVVFDFGQEGTQALVLRGTSEGAALNMGGVNIGVLSATVLYITVEWTEE